MSVRDIIIAQDWPGVDGTADGPPNLAGLRFSHRDHGEAPGAPPCQIQRTVFTEGIYPADRQTPRPAARNITFTRNSLPPTLPPPAATLARSRTCRGDGGETKRGSKRRLRNIRKAEASLRLCVRPEEICGRCTNRRD